MTSVRKFVDVDQPMEATSVVDAKTALATVDAATTLHRSQVKRRPVYPPITDSDDDDDEKEVVNRCRQAPGFLVLSVYTDDPANYAVDVNTLCLRLDPDHKGAQARAMLYLALALVTLASERSVALITRYRTHDVQRANRSTDRYAKAMEDLDVNNQWTGPDLEPDADADRVECALAGMAAQRMLLRLLSRVGCLRITDLRAIVYLGLACYRLQVLVSGCSDNVQDVFRYPVEIKRLMFLWLDVHQFGLTARALTYCMQCDVHPDRRGFSLRAFRPSFLAHLEESSEMQKNDVFVALDNVVTRSGRMYEFYYQGSKDHSEEDAAILYTHAPSSNSVRLLKRMCMPPSCWIASLAKCMQLDEHTCLHLFAVGVDAKRTADLGTAWQPGPRGIVDEYQVMFSLTPVLLMRSLVYCADRIVASTDNNYDWLLRCIDSRDETAATVPIEVDPDKLNDAAKRWEEKKEPAEVKQKPLSSPPPLPPPPPPRPSLLPLRGPKVTPRQPLPKPQRTTMGLSNPMVRTAKKPKRQTIFLAEPISV